MLGLPGGSGETYYKKTPKPIKSLQGSNTTGTAAALKPSQCMKHARHDVLNDALVYMS